MTLKNNRTSLLCYFKFGLHHFQSGNAHFGSNLVIFVPCHGDFGIWRIALTNNRTPVLCYFKLRVLFHSHWWMDLDWSYSPETIDSGQNWRCFLFRVTLKFDGWPGNTIGHLFCSIPSLVHHSEAICEFKLQLRSGNAQKGGIFVLTSVILTFNLRPWPFAWASLLPMVINHKHLMGWQEHCEKGVADRRTGRRTYRTIPRAAWWQLKPTDYRALTPAELLFVPPQRIEPIDK